MTGIANLRQNSRLLVGVLLCLLCTGPTGAMGDATAGQLVGAVLGTFGGTVLLCALIILLVHCCRVCCCNGRTDSSRTVRPADVESPTKSKTTTARGPSKLSRHSQANERRGPPGNHGSGACGGNEFEVDTTGDSSRRSLIDVPLNSGAMAGVCGLGFDVSGDKTGAVFVHDVYKEGPARLSGKIHPGDQLLGITVSTENMQLEDALIILSYAAPYPVIVRLRPKDTLPPASTPITVPQSWTVPPYIRIESGSPDVVEFQPDFGRERRRRGSVVESTQRILRVVPRRTLSDTCRCSASGDLEQSETTKNGEELSTDWTLKRCSGLSNLGVATNAGASNGEVEVTTSSKGQLLTCSSAVTERCATVAPFGVAITPSHPAVTAETNHRHVDGEYFPEKAAFRIEESAQTANATSMTAVENVEMGEMQSASFPRKMSKRAGKKLHKQPRKQPHEDRIVYVHYVDRPQTQTSGLHTGKTESGLKAESRKQTSRMHDRRSPTERTIVESENVKPVKRSESLHGSPSEAVKVETLVTQAAAPSAAETERDSSLYVRIATLQPLEVNREVLEQLARSSTLSAAAAEREPGPRRSDIFYNVCLDDPVHVDESGTATRRQKVDMKSNLKSLFEADDGDESTKSTVDMLSNLKSLFESDDPAGATPTDKSKQRRRQPHEDRTVYVHYLQRSAAGKTSGEDPTTVRIESEYAQVRCTGPGFQSSGTNGEQLATCVDSQSPAAEIVLKVDDLKLAGSHRERSVDGPHGAVSGTTAADHVIDIETLDFGKMDKCRLEFFDVDSLPEEFFEAAGENEKTSLETSRHEQTLSASHVTTERASSQEEAVMNRRQHPDANIHANPRAIYCYDSSSQSCDSVVDYGDAETAWQQRTLESSTDSEVQAAGQCPTLELVVRRRPEVHGGKADDAEDSSATDGDDDDTLKAEEETSEADDESSLPHSRQKFEKTDARNLQEYRELCDHYTSQITLPNDENFDRESSTVGTLTSCNFEEASTSSEQKEDGHEDRPDGASTDQEADAVISDEVLRSLRRWSTPEVRWYRRDVELCDELMSHDEAAEEEMLRHADGQAVSKNEPEVDSAANGLQTVDENWVTRKTACSVESRVGDDERSTVSVRPTLLETLTKFFDLDIDDVRKQRSNDVEDIIGGGFALHGTADAESIHPSREIKESATMNETAAEKTTPAANGQRCEQTPATEVDSKRSQDDAVTVYLPQFQQTPKNVRSELEVCVSPIEIRQDLTTTVVIATHAVLPTVKMSKGTGTAIDSVSARFDGDLGEDDRRSVKAAAASRKQIILSDDSGFNDDLKLNGNGCPVDGPSGSGGGGALTTTSSGDRFAGYQRQADVNNNEKLADLKSIRTSEEHSLGEDCKVIAKRGRDMLRFTDDRKFSDFTKRNDDTLGKRSGDDESTSSQKRPTDTVAEAENSSSLYRRNCFSDSELGEDYDDDDVEFHSTIWPFDDNPVPVVRLLPPEFHSSDYFNHARSTDSESTDSVRRADERYFSDPTLSSRFESVPYCPPSSADITSDDQSCCALQPIDLRRLGLDPDDATSTRNKVGDRSQTVARSTSIRISRLIVHLGARDGDEQASSASTSRHHPAAFIGRRRSSRRRRRIVCLTREVASPPSQ